METAPLEEECSVYKHAGPSLAPPLLRKSCHESVRRHGYRGRRPGRTSSDPPARLPTATVFGVYGPHKPIVPIHVSAILMDNSSVHLDASLSLFTYHVHGMVRD